MQSSPGAGICREKKEQAKWRNGPVTGGPGPGGGGGDQPEPRCEVAPVD